MKKQLQKLLLLAAMILVPWVTQGQTLDTYSFSNGVDASKWITLSSQSNVFES